MDNKRPDIYKKLKGHNIQLVEIEGKKIKNSKKESEVVLNNSVKTKVDIINKDDELLKLGVSIEVGFEPESIFKIRLEYLIEYLLNEPLSDEEIKLNYNELIKPIGHEFSYVTSFISCRMINQPIVMPPMIQYKDKDC